MSRSRKKYPCSYVVAWTGSNKSDKRLHNRIIRNIGKRDIIKIISNPDGADNIPIKFKKTEGLDIYCFRSDGGNRWWSKDELDPEDYKRIFRK